MSEEQVSSAADRQVRVQLTSKEEEVALPDNTGPILVPTGKKILVDVAIGFSTTYIC